VLTTATRNAPKSAQPFPSPNVSWSIVRLEIYALSPVAVEKSRLDTLAFCVIKFWEYPYVVDRS
jgi:hypothetical protein